MPVCKRQLSQKSTAVPRVYQRRQPERTAAYQTALHHLETWLSTTREAHPDEFCNAVFWRMDLLASAVKHVMKTSLSPIRAKAVVSVHPAIPNACSKRQPIWSSIFTAQFWFCTTLRDNKWLTTKRLQCIAIKETIDYCVKTSRKLRG